MQASSSSSIEIEFSLALNNRTGKFFMCRDMIEDLRDLIAGVRYWRTTDEGVPRRLRSKILSKLMSWEFKAREYPAIDKLIPKMRCSNPLLFTDPLQVSLYKLDSQDSVVVYDMGPVTHPDLYAKGVSEKYHRVFDTIRVVKPSLIFVSQSSKSEYEKLYGGAYSVAHIVYPGLRSEINRGPVDAIASVKPPFLLTVGAVGSRKNQLRTLNAFAESGLAEKGFSYVICGGTEPGFEKVASRANELSWAHLTGYTTDAQLRWLYDNAAGFVLPSLLEGFGIPAAESVLRGLVPLVSKGGALHEVTGDSAILVDPYNTASIASGMNELVALSAQEKASRLSAMRQHLTFFTPERARAGWLQAIDRNSSVGHAHASS